MKIWGEVPKVSQVYEKKNASKVDTVSGSSGKQDVVSISNNAKDFQTVMKALKDVPDIRKDKVEEIREKYESGDYEISGSEIADKVMKSLTDK